MNLTPIPTHIELHQKSKTLDVTFNSGEAFTFTAEYLRVFSPSAEVQGHGGHGAVLQTGKQFVGIESVFAVGNYAIGIKFDDGHDSGIFTWKLLFELGNHHAQNWSQYLEALEEAGADRAPHVSTGPQSFTP